MEELIFRPLRQDELDDILISKNISSPLVISNTEAVTVIVHNNSNKISITYAYVSKSDDKVKCETSSSTYSKERDVQVIGFIKKWISTNLIIISNELLLNQAYRIDVKLDNGETISEAINNKWYILIIENGSRLIENVLIYNINGEEMYNMRR